MGGEGPFKTPAQGTPKPEQPRAEAVDKERQALEDQEWFEAWMRDHPETVIPPENRRECGPEIAEVEEMLSSFESTHSLTELHAITHLEPDEIKECHIREAARIDLLAIAIKLEVLEKETNISREKYAELAAKYKPLSNAVGIIKGTTVKHEF